MRPALIVLGVVAVVVAGGTGLVLHQYIANQDALVKESTQPIVEAPKTLSVLVAADTVGVGKILDSSSLGWQDWPEKIATEAGWAGLISVRNETDKSNVIKNYIGAVARVSLIKGEPITEDKVVQAGKGSTLATILQPGMRSVTIPVDALNSADGLIQAGDRVDLMLTYDLTDPGAGNVDPLTGKQRPHYVTETILKDILLLSLNKRMTVTTAADTPPPTNATLEVTQVQAEKIATAQRMGKLGLTLRPFRISDDQIRPGIGVTTDLTVMPKLQAARQGNETSDVDSYNPFDVGPLLRAEAERVAMEKNRKDEEERLKAQAAAKKPNTITIYRWSAPTQVQLDSKGNPVGSQQPNGAAPPVPSAPSAQNGASSKPNTPATNTPTNSSGPSMNKDPGNNNGNSTSNNTSSSNSSTGSSNGNTGNNNNNSGSSSNSGDDHIYHYHGPSHGV